MLSAWLVARIEYRHRRKRPSGGNIWRLLGIRDFYEGWLYIKGNPKIAYIMLFKTGWCLAGAMNMVLTLFGERIYNFGGRPDIGVAVLFVGRAAGTAFGPIIGRRLVGEDTERGLRAILVAFLIAAVTYACLGLVDHPLLAWLCVFVSHMGGGLIWVFSTVMLQKLVPDSYLGRVLSAELGLATLMISISLYSFSLIAEQPGTNLTELPLYLGGLLLFSCIVFTAFARHPKVKGVTK